MRFLFFIIFTCIFLMGCECSVNKQYATLMNEYFERNVAEYNRYVEADKDKTAEEKQATLKQNNEALLLSREMKEKGK